MLAISLFGNYAAFNLSFARALVVLISNFQFLISIKCLIFNF